jgi:mono/diheme cytochrome c family protein
MSEPRELAGALVLYGSPDELADGIARAREMGYSRMDVVSPYPIHGIDHLLGKGPSPLGYVALAAGLLGVTLAKLAQWWMSALSYPLNIGGKPLFSWPAFIPVTFEVMVLSASVATVLGMIAILNGLPQYGSALLRSRHMPRLTRDGFGLVLDARDPRFDEHAIRVGLAEGREVDLLYRTPVHRFYGEQVLSVRFLLLLVAIALASVGVTRLVWKYAGAMPPYSFMKRQPKLNPQTATTAFADGMGMRLPADGTLAREEEPYAYETDADGAGRDLVNPIPLTPETLERGRAKYNIYCRPCHGIHAEGNGTLTSAFPRPPTLHTSKVREWSDGRIYHVITMGQNAMPAYRYQIPAESRWTIIQYLRALQRSRNAREEDVP